MQMNQAFSIEEIVREGGFPCHCGKNHKTSLKEIVLRKGALADVPALVKKYQGSRAFVIADKNTYQTAGEAVCTYLGKENVPFSLYVYPQDHLEPDEHAIGQVIMHYDHHCDFIIAVGSGTINDIGKIVARTTNHPYMIVGTAPSMDGYASATSSMIRDNIKISLDSMCPTIILADPDIVSMAPVKLLQSGIGDMLAKYISICEWRISHVINDEYYCERIAAMVRASLEKCVTAKRLLDRNPEDIKAVMEGLILSGLAMGFAGVSRPASGLEHYFSHIWEMRGLEFNTPVDLHGIQCGVGTLLALRIYRFIQGVQPDREKATAFVKSFSLNDWHAFLGHFLGKGAEELIRLEKKEGKYNPETHGARLEKIIAHWDEIQQVITEELPTLEKLELLMKDLGAPVTPQELGHSSEDVRNVFLATKDIRDKYIASRLLWDLGLLDEAAQCL